MKFVLLTLWMVALTSSTFAFQLSIIFNEATPVAPEVQNRVERIRDQIEKIVSSGEFEKKTQDYTYTCFDSNNLPVGVSDLAGVLKFLDQAQAKVEISFFTENSSVVGSTTGNNISFNTTFFDRNDDASIANTLFHETLHTLKFAHCGKNNIRLYPKIKRSVPYRFGDLVEALWQNNDTTH